MVRRADMWSSISGERAERKREAIRFILSKNGGEGEKERERREKGKASNSRFETSE